MFEIGPEGKKIEKSRKGNVAIFHQLESEFPEITLCLGHGLGSIALIYQERKAQTPPQGAIAVLKGLEQQLKLLLSEPQLGKKSRHGPCALGDNPLACG